MVVRAGAALLLVGTCLLAVLPITPAVAATDRNRIVDVTFPVAGPVSFADDYDQPRGGGVRRHQATDIYGAKLQRVHAAASGSVCAATGIDGPMPSFGYQLKVCGDDGITYAYVHLNNDRPGTDDGRGGAGNAYAPGIRVGARVSRGQWLGYLGDSGNAEDTRPHLHFEMLDPDLDDPAIAEAPWQPHRLNPYPSLREAMAQRDLPGSGALRQGDRGPAVAQWQSSLNAAIAAGLATDGVFGAATLAATLTFQRSQGLTEDGVVGPATLRAMAAVLEGGGAPVSATPSTAYRGRALRLTDPLMRGDDVRLWQQRIHELGWDIVADSYFGPASHQIARAFQAEAGLTVDGVVGPATWAATFADG